MSHVVIRTVRPYASEAEYLQAEGWTITRKGVVLLDQDTHPSGTVVRFEVKLQDGKRLLRAEGVVVTSRPAAAGYPSQLELRFTRFDAATKALIESAEAVAALTEDDFEEIDDIEALSDVEASAPVQTDRAPNESGEPTAPDSAPGVQGRARPEARPSAPPYSEPNPTLDDAVAELAESAQRSPASAQGSSPVAADLNDSALKLDALISQALSEPPPASVGLELAALPASDPLPTLLDQGAPIDPDVSDSGSDLVVDGEPHSSHPPAPSASASGVHPRPTSDGPLRPIATPARRDELLAKLRERAQAKAQSGSGTSSGT